MRIEITQKLITEEILIQTHIRLVSRSKKNHMQQNCNIIEEHCTDKPNEWKNGWKYKLYSTIVAAYFSHSLTLSLT